jgi:hypothetical protein
MRVNILLCLVVLAAACTSHAAVDATSNLAPNRAETFSVQGLGAPKSFWGALFLYFNSTMCNSALLSPLNRTVNDITVAADHPCAGTRQRALFTLLM